MKAFLGAVSAVVLAFTVACSQSDAGITTAVKSKLVADDMVKAYKVDVDTQKNVVTLSGEVDTQAQREHAVLIARNTKGVADVIDRLTVNPTAATSGVDVTIDDRFEADVKKGADSTADAAKRGADATGNAVKRGAEATVDATKRGAEATADAAKRGAEKTEKGAKKVGGAIKDVFTDDDQDSDKDGK
jgi:hyperosmotically inducible protein